MSDAITGGCNCGTVRYEVTAPLVSAMYCHCRRCQRRSGAAASPSALAEPGTFHITSGESALKSWQPEDGAAKWFCGECGSAMFAALAGPPPTVAVRMGTFDTDPGIRPSRHVFCESAAAWEPLPDDGLPRFPQRSS